MLYMYSEMQNKLSKTRELPLKSMGQIISSGCPYLNLFNRCVLYNSQGDARGDMIHATD